MNNRVRSFWLAVILAVLAGSGVFSSQMFVAAAVVGFIAYRDGWLCGLFVGIVALATDPTVIRLIQDPGYFHESVRNRSMYDAYGEFLIYGRLISLLPTTVLGGYCGARFRVRVWSAAGLPWTRRA